MARLLRRFEKSAQPLILATMEFEIRVVQLRMLSTRQLARDQIWHVREVVNRVKLDQVRLDLAAAHQVNASQQNAVDIKQRLGPRRMFLLEQLPLRFCKTQVVVSMIARDTARREALKLFMLRRRL